MSYVGPFVIVAIIGSTSGRRAQCFSDGVQEGPERAIADMCHEVLDRHSALPPESVSRSLCTVGFAVARSYKLLKGDEDATDMVTENDSQMQRQFENE
eukprot:8265857-Pyramimonas_sp.AAC.1